MERLENSSLKHYLVTIMSQSKYLKYIEYQRAYAAAHRKTRATAASAWAAANPDKRRVNAARYRTLNKEKVLKIIRKWKKDHPEDNRERQAARRARAKMPIARLHRAEVRAFYLACPPGHHVDHQIPLHGKLISGLHVPWNLQYLTAEENQRKSNHYGSD